MRGDRRARGPRLLKAPADDLYPPARPRPGHHQLAQHRLRPPGPCGGHGPARIPADLPATGLGGARPARLVGHAAGHRARGAGQGGPWGRWCARHRHHQPARDHAGLGPPHRRARLQRHRLAGPPHRGGLREAARGGPRGPGAAQDRTAHRRLFLRHQAAVDPGQRERCALAGRPR